MTTLGVAIFVKTPGVSPVKTRLAESLGEARAREFYELSTACVLAVARLAAEECPVALTPYWAVAENEALGDTRWQGLERLAQGGGALGARLDRVYAELLARGHGYACVLGADSPQLTANLLIRTAALAQEEERPFVLGPARDGGFYLFAGGQPLESALWNSVPYSTRETGRQLAAAVKPRAPVRVLPPLTDVDVGDDIPKLKRELEVLGPALLPEQGRLLQWLGPALASLS